MISLAVILVDYENVNATDGLKGLEYLNEKDELIIFYSQCCKNIRADYIELIEKSNCDFKIYELVKSGKNALDFYIAVECGILSLRGIKDICIISKDKGFCAISDFFKIKSDMEYVTVNIAPNIEKALLLSGDTERKNMIRTRSKSLNITVEQARIKEHKEFVNRIIKLFEETEYREKITSIIKFIESPRIKTNRCLYTSSLHTFGREEGRAIYRILKEVV